MSILCLHGHRHDAAGAPQRAGRGDHRRARPGGRDRRRAARLAPDRAHFSPRLARQRRVLGDRHGGGRRRRRRGSSSCRPIPRQRSTSSIERELPVQGVELLRERGSRRPDPRLVRLGRLRDRQPMYDDGAGSSSTGATTCTTRRSSRSTTVVRGAEPGWEEIIDRYDVDALLFPPYRADHEGPGRGCRLVRGVPRRQRGRLPADLRLTALVVRAPMRRPAAPGQPPSGRRGATVVGAEVRVEEQPEQVDRRDVVREDVLLPGREGGEEDAGPLEQTRPDRRRPDRSRSSRRPMPSRGRRRGRSTGGTSEFATIPSIVSRTRSFRYGSWAR